MRYFIKYISYPQQGYIAGGLWTKPINYEVSGPYGIFHSITDRIGYKVYRNYNDIIDAFYTNMHVLMFERTKDFKTLTSSWHHKSVYGYKSPMMFSYKSLLAMCMFL